MMMPSKPSSPRSLSVRIPGERVEGMSEPVTAGAAMCAAITRGAPAAMPARNVTISQASISSQLLRVKA